MTVILGENTTEEFWDIDGVSLHQHGWNVETVGGERYDLPRRRGENIRFAYRPGTVHRNKVPESKMVNLAMWMQGSEPNGAPASDPVLQWNDNWDFLRRTVWKPNGTQLQLTRRWRLSSAEQYGPQALAATALAELTNTVTPRMTSRARSMFVFEFLLADPFFYGPLEGQQIRQEVPQVITNWGHDVAAHSFMSVDFVGPLSNPRLINFSTTPAVQVKFNGTIDPGRTVSLNVSQFQAHMTNTSADASNVIGKISHAGARYWFGLQPGPNHIALEADSGSGQAVLRWRPPYL